MIFSMEAKNTQTIKTSVTFLLYRGESKVLRYFGNMRKNSASPDVLVEVVKLADYTAL